MKNTIVKYLLDIIECNLMLSDKKIIYHIDENYFLTKEQEQKDEFALKFAGWYHSANNNEYHLHPKLNIKEHLEIYKKQYENI